MDMKAKVIDRRAFLVNMAAGFAGVACNRSHPHQTAIPQRRLTRFPEKADLYLLTDRPPQLETPLHYFRQDLTPNEAFFVRWHLEGVPTAVSPDTFRLTVDGHVRTPLSLTLEDLRTKFEAVEIIAVCQCSGNARGLFEPRVPGGQWQQGAMGNARWMGVRLKDILDRAGVRAGAVDVSFDGLDTPPMPGVSDFVKALGIDHARDGDVLVAYEMNGRELPVLNGFPLRLVVPGWYATYWVKALSRIVVLPNQFKGFWMTHSYLLADNPNGSESPDHLSAAVAPISKFSVHSIFVRPEPGEMITVGETYRFEGLAMDDGTGIGKVEVSIDGGARWAMARLDPELGKYSWRRWRFDASFSQRGSYKVMVKATNNQGRTQLVSHWNRSGYMRTLIEQVELTVT